MSVLNIKPFSSSPTPPPKLKLTKSLDFSPLRPHKPQNPLLPDDKPRLTSPHADLYPKTDDEKRLLIARSLQAAFADQHLSFEDLSPQRNFVCYRIVRELGRQMGLFTSGESMEDAVSQITDRSTLDAPKPNPWTENVSYSLPTVTTRSCPDLLRTLIRARELPAENYPYLSILRTEQTKDHTPLGLGVLPPTVPISHYDIPTGEPLPSYDAANPEHDPLFHLYLEAVSLVIEHLDLLNANPENEPEHNRYGLVCLLDPHLIRHIFASPTQIVEVENALIDEALISIVSRGISRTLKFMHTQYGLHQHESVAVVDCARSRATDLVKFDIDADRAVMAMRLEDLARRAREALDPRTELMALKALGVVQGLARAEPDDAFKEFTTIVRAVTSDRKKVENTAAPALPSPTKGPVRNFQSPKLDIVDVIERATGHSSE